MVKAILNQLVSNWQMLAVVAAVSLVVGALPTYKVTSFYYEAEILSIKAVEAAAEADRKNAVIEAQQKAMKLAAHRETLSNEVSYDYEKDIADLQRRYDAELNRLRDEAVRTSGVDGMRLPELPPSPSQRDGTACRNGLSNRDKERLLEIAKKADEQTQRLIACQAWVREQQRATK